MADTDQTQVILIDEADCEIGTMEKMEAHRQARLHRAVSVFIFNSKGEWLLQRRACHKYHSGGLWTNTCCTHPYPNESYAEGAGRRLHEEMGITCSLQELFHFRYESLLDHGLTENELDHVFIGYSDQLPQLNTDEVCEYRYVTLNTLNHDIQTHPSLYTYWFTKIYCEVAKHLPKKQIRHDQPTDRKEAVI